jgi:signal transduction histidine kinase
MTLDVNRLDLGRVVLSPSRFPLGDLLHELADEVETRIDDSGVRRVWPADLDSLPVLEIDRAKLKIILRNLIDNALKFTSKGTVSVGATTHGDHVAVHVSDTGIGIAAEDLDAIFEVFHQVRDDHQPRRGGVGLGLYLVRRYCELLGARVRVESEPGTGSTFTVELPLPGSSRAA